MAETLSYKLTSNQAEVSKATATRNLVGLLPLTQSPFFLERKEQNLTLHLLRKAVIADLGSEHGNELIFLTATG